MTTSAFSSEIPSSNSELDALNERQNELIKEETTSLMVGTPALAVTAALSKKLKSRINQLKTQRAESIKRYVIKKQTGLSTASARKGHFIYKNGPRAAKLAKEGKLVRGLTTGTYSVFALNLINLSEDIIEHVEVRDKMHNIIACDPTFLESINPQDEVSNNLLELVDPITHLEE